MGFLFFKVHYTTHGGRYAERLRETSDRKDLLTRVIHLQPRKGLDAIGEIARYICIRHLVVEYCG